MDEEVGKLKGKLQRLEYVLERQRWKQKEQAMKFEQTTTRLEERLRDLELENRKSTAWIDTYRMVLNSLQEGVYVMDADGNVKALNQRAEDLLEPEDVLPALLKASTGKPVEADSSDSSDLKMPSGKSGDNLKVAARPMIDADGKIMGSLAIICLS